MKMSRHLTTALIVAGIGVMLIPVVGKLYLSYQHQQALREFESRMNELDLALEIQSSSPDDPGNPASSTDAAPSPSPAIGISYEEEYYLIDGHQITGVIDIPKIRLKSPIVEGVALENLQFAIGHFPGTAKLGQKGNVVLAGHRSYTFGSFFSRIDELVAGDTIYLEGISGRYQYQVYDHFLVLPSDVSVLEIPPDRKNEAILTLITCHPVYNPTHRLIIRAVKVIS